MKEKKKRKVYIGAFIRDVLCDSIEGTWLVQAHSWALLRGGLTARCDDGFIGRIAEGGATSSRGCYLRRRHGCIGTKSERVLRRTTAGSPRRPEWTLGILGERSLK